LHGKKIRHRSRRTSPPGGQRLPPPLRSGDAARRRSRTARFARNCAMVSSLVRPATTDYLQCQGFSGKLSKVHPREPFSLAVFFIQPGFSFFRERFAAPDTLSFLSGFKLRFFSTAFLKIPRKYKNENSRLRSTGVLPVDERRSRFRWGVSPFYPNFVYGKALLLSGYAGIPSSAMRARTSSLGASRLGTSLRTKRVMSFSTPSFSSAYLANCL